MSENGMKTITEADLKSTKGEDLKEEKKEEKNFENNSGNLVININELEQKINNMHIDELNNFINSLNNIIDKRSKSLGARRIGGITTTGIITRMGLAKIFLDQIEIGYFNTLSGEQIIIERSGNYLLRVDNIRNFNIDINRFDICIDLDTIKLRKK